MVGRIAGRRLIVVEGPPSAFDRAVAEVQAAGWTIVHGFGSGASDERASPRPLESGAGAAGSVVRVGSVETSEDAASVVIAVLGGAGVVVAARGPGEVIDLLVVDLGHLGPVEHRVGEAEGRPQLQGEARAILGLLAEGHSLGEAAHLLGVSRRTADRRLANARRALGVTRTPEAVARAKRLGWLR